MVTSLLTDTRLRIWLSGAVLTTWSLTLKTVEMIVDFRRSPNSPSWTALLLQWSHSGSWAAPSHRTWSGTLTWTPLWKRPSRCCTSFRQLRKFNLPQELNHHWIHPLHINICLVQFSYQIWPQKTTEGSPDCWAHHWYNPPHSPRPVLIQSEQKGWKNHSGPFTSSTLPLWTVTIWSTRQSSEHQNGQTQEQFLPSGNPSHEHLTVIMVHNIYTLI